MKKLRKIILRLLSSLIFILLGIPLFANVVLTDSEYDALLQRLKNDKILLANENIIWEELKKSKPKITYEIINDNVVIQTVEIPIYKNKPIIYEVKFLIEKKEDLKWVPWTFQLCGMAETTFTNKDKSKYDILPYLKVGDKFNIYPDFKIGVRFFSTLPLGIKYFAFGFNVFVGIKSSGFSLSYSLPKPLKNTSIHLYIGIDYTAKLAYGIGISLNF